MIELSLNKLQAASRVLDEQDVPRNRGILTDHGAIPYAPHGAGLAKMAAALAARGSSLTFNGQPVRPEQRIKHRAPKLRRGIGAPSTGAQVAGPDPLKRAMCKQRELAGMSPCQQKKLFKEQRRLDREANKSAAERDSDASLPVQG